jgi:hypothetical protein
VVLPSDAQGFLAGVIGLQVDLIMLTDAVLLCFQTVYPFTQFVWVFFGAGALQPCIQSVGSGSKTTGEIACGIFFNSLTSRISS